MFMLVGIIVVAAFAVMHVGVLTRNFFYRLNQKYRN